MKQCKIEGCNNPIWSKELCRNHIPKKAISHISKYHIPTIDVTQDIYDMHTFFIGIWNKRLHKSEVSGEKLFSPPSSAYFHHILRKESHEESKYDEDNIVLLSMDEHANVESNMYRYEEINRRRELLKIKYKTHSI